MVISLVTMLTRNLGIQTVVNEISRKEKFLRKKYMGVLRCESTRVRVHEFKLKHKVSVINGQKKLYFAH